MQKISCAVLGQENSYHSQAAATVLGNVEQVPCSNFSEIIAAVKSGRATFGVLAVENSSIGKIKTSSTILQRAVENKEIVVTGEYKMPINHCLAGTKNASIQKIKHVVSHPAAIKQCRKIITKYDWEALLVSDTASGVAEVAREQVPTIGAIANKTAALAAGLTILKENIQDNRINHTNFKIFTAVGALEEYRKQLDSIDAELLSVLSKRQQLISAIAYNKKQRKLPTLDKNREKEIISRQKQQAAVLDLNPDYIDKMYHIILNYSKKKQREKNA